MIISIPELNKIPRKAFIEEQHANLLGVKVTIVLPNKQLLIINKAYEEEKEVIFSLFNEKRKPLILATMEKDALVKTVIKYLEDDEDNMD